jgi:hypothetical protein
MDTEKWYIETKNKIVSLIGKGYFPIFRFSDGEAYFCLGYRMPPPQPGVNAAVHYIRTFLSAYVKYRCHRTFWSGLPGYGHEIYSGGAWISLRRTFSLQLKSIAETGLIAGNFCHHHIPGMMDRYLPDIFDWFDEQTIDLNVNNYVPFYFVYGMLLGPERALFLKGRKILIVTNLTSEKQENLSRYLYNAAAREVNFISISRSSSMTERIVLKPEHDGTELVLIGAGVGAANILEMVKPLGALSIDAGYVLECYQNPLYKGTRVFTQPDCEIQQ